MKHLEDICWDKVVERLDLVDPEDLARAEQRLAEVEAAPLSRDVVEEMVAQAAPRRILVFRKMNAIAKVAAVVVAALMLTAGGYWLIWRERVHSSNTAIRPGTMTYAMAINMLRDEGQNQPLEARRIAMLFAAEVVKHGLTTLRTIRDDTRAPSELSEAARRELGALATLANAGGTTPPQPFDGDPEAIASMALVDHHAAPERVRQVELVAEFTARGIQGLLAMQGLDRASELERRRYLSRLSAELGR